MRVCLVCPYSWSFPGGVLEHVDALGGALSRRGHEVKIVAPNDPLDLRTRMLHPKLGRHGKVPDHVVPLGRSVPLPSNGSLGNLAFSPTLIPKLTSFFHRFRPDVVHVHEPLLPLLSLAAIRAAAKLGSPTIGTFHAYYPQGCPHYRLFGRVLDPFFRELSAKIAVSEPAAETASRHFPGEYRIIPNGVDMGRFRPPESLSRNPGEVLFVGRSARKGLSVLLQAFPEVVRRIPGAKLTVVGSRPEDVKLPKSLVSSVEIRGMVDEDGLVEAMHSASVLCAPSMGAESFGIVLIEGMAAGLAVVASDIPGYNTVVSDGEDGKLVPPGDVRALAGALVHILEDGEERERLSQSGLESARRYDWPRIVAEVEEVYAGVNRT